MPFSRRAAYLSAALALVFAAQPALAGSKAFAPSPDAIRAHMTFLADDLMEGREAGTRGYDLAANYVTSQFALLGLKPAGDAGSYLQTVPLTAYRPASNGEFKVAEAGAAPSALTFGEDFLPSPQADRAELSLDAPLVFVGFGISAPERGRDDFAGLDVKGKIVVLLSGAPKGFQTEERAHYGSIGVKRAEAARRGAVGVLTLATPAGEKRRPFARGVGGNRDWRMTWRAPDGAPFVRGGSAPSLASISVKGGEKLFGSAAGKLAAAYAAAETQDGKVEGFALPTTAAVALKTEIQKRRSSNVAALIEGSDPTLKSEVVVLSAHLDHEGIKENPKPGEDAIYNGALDNASGIATLLEVGRGFTSGKARPKRSILLLAVTAEEKGLIGSEYFAHNPTVSKANLAADVNLDMPVLLYPFVDVVAFGADRSTIGPIVAKAAARVDVALSPDPMPEEGLFTRSDHYRFVEQGVPSVFLMTGFKNGGEKAFKDFLATHYHKVNDDLAQPIDYQAAAKFARVNYEIAHDLADAPARPTWKAGDFFGGIFAPKGHPSAAH
ncbi:M28 family peptidase [Caulobacter hibisci]|uniref:M28 family peptidase n=1 Tax=Caulobacter hibisci TaxID=2035993 RepID=A0ABS0SSV4_9CAUL|nr:M28 family peptidase [Caulobacter hibisci]MBI1682584.1 M28 family peptidase [Caulobacter hibisci]